MFTRSILPGLLVMFCLRTREEQYGRGTVDDGGRCCSRTLLPVPPPSHFPFDSRSSSKVGGWRQMAVVPTIHNFLAIFHNFLIVFIHHFSHRFKVVDISKLTLNTIFFKHTHRTLHFLQMFPFSHVVIFSWLHSSHAFLASAGSSYKSSPGRFSGCYPFLPADSSTHSSTLAQRLVIFILSPQLVGSFWSPTQRHNPS